MQWPYHAHKFQISINRQGRTTSYIWLAFRHSRKQWNKGGTPDFPVKGAGMRDPWTRIRHLHFFYSTPCLPPKKFCITFVFNLSWVFHSSLEKLKIMLTVFTRKTPRLLLNFSTVKCGSYLRASLSLFLWKLDAKQELFQLWYYYGQTPLYGHPLNTDTSLSWAVCFVPAGERKPLHFLLI